MTKLKLAHLSDPHFGRIAHPEVVDAIVESVNRQDPDLVAVSGDLTQRATSDEFRRAHAFVGAFEAPVVVVPGNHDVYPWWRPISRLFWPLRRYRRWFSDDLLPAFERDDLAVLGVNTAHGWSIKNGWIQDDHVEAIVSFFTRQPPAAYKVLVLHHHLMRLQRFGSHDVARRASTALKAVEKCEVDLILCGHLHESHIEQIGMLPGNHQLVVASAGTVASDRGRGEDTGINGYNLIEVTDREEVIVEKRYDPNDERFEPYRRSKFTREGTLIDQTS